MHTRILSGIFAIAFLLAISGCGKPSAATKAADAKKRAAKKRTANDVKPGDVTDKDKEYSTKLMADGGRWKFTETDEDGTTNYLILYLPQGILNQKVDDEDMTSGTWEVRDGYLIWMLDGVKTADKIKDVTDKEFTYVDHETGKTVSEIKAKD